MATGFFKAKFVSFEGNILREVELTAWVDTYEVDYYFKDGIVFDIPSEKRRLEQEYGKSVFVRMKANPKVRLVPISLSKRQEIQSRQSRPWLGSIVRRVSSFFNF